MIIKNLTLRFTLNIQAIAVLIVEIIIIILVILWPLPFSQLQN